jgi:hypothetical protein
MIMAIVNGVSDGDVEANAGGGGDLDDGDGVMVMVVVTAMALFFWDVMLISVMFIVTVIEPFEAIITRI